MSDIEKMQHEKALILSNYEGSLSEAQSLIAGLKIELEVEKASWVGVEFRLNNMIDKMSKKKRILAEYKLLGRLLKSDLEAFKDRNEILLKLTHSNTPRSIFSGIHNNIIRLNSQIILLEKEIFQIKNDIRSIKEIDLKLNNMNYF